MASLLSDPVAMIVRYKYLLARTTVSDLKQRYAGLAGGLVWVVLSPLLMMILYAVIYVAVFQIHPIGLTRAEYVLYMFSGLILLIGFVEALMAGTTSLSANRAVLLNTVFPAELVPVRAVLVAHGTTLFGVLILLLGAMVVGTASVTLLLVPLFLLLQVMFVAGLSFVLSLANLALRDIQQFLAFAAMILLIASPVSYTPDMVPPRLIFVLYLNPFSYFVLSFHDLIVFGRLPSVLTTTACALLGIGGFCLGFAIFRTVKQAFLDYA